MEVMNYISKGKDMLCSRCKKDIKKCICETYHPPSFLGFYHKKDLKFNKSELTELLTGFYDPTTDIDAEIDAGIMYSSDFRERKLREAEELNYSRRSKEITEMLEVHYEMKAEIASKEKERIKDHKNQD